MRRLSLFVICYSLFHLGASEASAQVNMPDPSAIAGIPLPAPELPNATVSVRVVRERMGNNVAKQEVTLNVGSTPRRGTTDEQGRAQFTGITPGTIVQATSTVDGEVLTSQQFSVPATGGVRVALIAGIATAAAREKAAAEAAAREPARPGIVEIGPDSRVVVEFQDDLLTVFYLLEVVNNARTPIDTGGPLVIELPAGAAGASVMQGSSPNVSAQGDRVLITGPFPPGKTMAQMGFTLPQAGASIAIRQQWPAAMAQVFVGVEKISNDLQMTSPQLTDTREMTTEQGSVFIMGTGGRLNPGQELVINLSGMPAHSRTPRNLVLALVALIFVAGGWLAFGPQRPGTQDEKLRARREKLMNDVVALERKRREKPLSPADEARLQRVTAELERVLAELDRGEAA